MTAEKQRKIGSKVGKAILVGALVLSFGGGSAYAGSKIGAKKLKTVTVRTSSIVVNANSSGSASVSCDDGERALSVWSANTATTGLITFLPSADVAVNAALTPATNPTGASASATNAGGTARNVSVSVACLKK